MCAIFSPEILQAVAEKGLIPLCDDSKHWTQKQHGSTKSDGGVGGGGGGGERRGDYPENSHFVFCANKQR